MEINTDGLDSLYMTISASIKRAMGIETKECQRTIGCLTEDGIQEALEFGIRIAEIGQPLMVAQGDEDEQDRLGSLCGNFLSRPTCCSYSGPLSMGVDKVREVFHTVCNAPFQACSFN